MDRIEHKTTEEHYNKYRDMVSRAGITFKNNRSDYMGFNKEQLLELYLEDSFLNNIPLRDFDCIYLYCPAHIRKIITNLADNICVLKHLLIYEILEATPIFVENGKNYKDYPPLKK